MQGTLAHVGSVTPATRAGIEKAVADGAFFWLDVEAVGQDVLDVFDQVFRFHPLVVEDLGEFGQRPKAEPYGDVTYLVVHGAPEADRPRHTVEVHFVVSERYLVTVHHGACGAIAEARKRVGEHAAGPTDVPQIGLLYLVIDQLVDSFFPYLNDFDDTVDALEDAILLQPTDTQLGTLFDLKRQLITVRKSVAPQRDMFAGITAGMTPLPGLTSDGTVYLRDLYDHLIRISDLVDNYRDLLSGALDTHLSTVSNRLNVVMKQLTIIATIFLPLSFLTGFFGQNFAWLVTHLGGPAAFFTLGIGLELLCAVGLGWYFRKKGWLGGSAT